MAVVLTSTDEVAKIIREQVKDLALDGDLKLNFFPNGAAYSAVEKIAKDLADLFAERKGQFKPESFLKKCGVRS